MDKSKIGRIKNFLLDSLGCSTKLRKSIQTLWKDSFRDRIEQTFLSKVIQLKNKAARVTYAYIHIVDI